MNLSLLLASVLALFGVSSGLCGGTIVKPGTYVLPRDCSTGISPALRILASDVILDLDGHGITCSPPDPESAVSIGIEASAGYDRVTVRNGSVSGCYMGVQLSGDDNLIDAVDFTGNAYIGFNGGGRGNVIFDSTFADLGGYTQEAYAIAINGPGSDCLIKGNRFENLYRQTAASPSKAGEGVGVLIRSDQKGCIVTHNRFRNDRPSGPAHTSIAAWVATGAAGHFRHNTIIGFPRGLIAAGDGVLLAEQNRLVLPFDAPNSYAIHHPAESSSSNIVIGYE